MAGLGEILQENSRLRESLAERERRLDALTAELAQREVEIARHEREREQHLAMLAVLRQQADDFAKRLEFIRLKGERARSERFLGDGQEGLPFPSEITLPPRDPVVEAREEDPSTSTKGRAKTSRRKIREDLSKRHLTVNVPMKRAACPVCQKPLQVTGTTSSGRYDWVPGHFVVLDVEREQCGCPDHPSAGTYAASEPFLLPRATCGNGLHARVIVDKFADHIPLHRQVGRMDREGLEIATSTLSGWVAQGADQVAPLVAAIRKQVLEDGPVLGDDTGLPVQDGDDGKLRKGRLWVFTDRQQAFYAFTATKHGEHPTELLAEIGGNLLLVDGGSEFNEAARKLGLERGGCWSHLRRYFFDARLQHDEAAIALIVARDLFAIEREHAASSPEQRLRVRQERSKPIVDGFYAWVREISTAARPTSLLGQAVGYAINQEPKMRLFLKHGELPIHNNLSELLLRQPVVGRKNWLFAKSEGGAQAAASWFTIIGSCMLQGVDPWTYLVDIYGRLPDHPANRVHELTPMSWRRALEAAAQPP